jgi:hypothetical protein
MFYRSILFVDAHFAVVLVSFTVCYLTTASQKRKGQDKLASSPLRFFCVCGAFSAQQTKRTTGKNEHQKHKKKGAKKCRTFQ